MDPPPYRPGALNLPGPCNGRYELPTLAEVRAAALSDEYREFLEETIGRRNATTEQIRSLGISAKPEQILASVLKGDQSSKSTQKTSFSGAHKVYSGIPRCPKQQVQESNENTDTSNTALARIIDAFWFDTVCNTDWDVPRSSIPTCTQFREAAIPQALALADAVKQWKQKKFLASTEPDPVPASGFDLFGSLCTSPELIIEVCKHLKPKDIVNLYSISGKFHKIVDDHMWSSVKTWAEHMAPGSVHIFSRDLYVDEFYVRDPAGRPADSAYYDMSHITIPEKERQQVVNNEVRLIPGLKWLQMVYNREVRIRDIIATLARMGHRLLPGADMLLKKIWLVMDISTSEGRVDLLQSEELFPSTDLYLFHLIMVKLNMAFNDPVYGPESEALMELMFGQRSLSALWALLRRKKYTTRLEIRQLKVAYDVEPTPGERLRGEPVYGVPIHEMGLKHLEGWGAGNEHLLRPDEAIIIESARRQLEFEDEVETMMLHGHIDFESGAPEVPTLEEMYMSDDELDESPNIEKHREAGAVANKVYKECGNVPFERGMWTPRDVKKYHHWDTLSEGEKQAITLEEKEEFSQTFDVKHWLYNLRFLQERLTDMLEAVKNKHGKYTVDIPAPPSGKVNGRLDRTMFAKWDEPSGLQTALKKMPDFAFPYEAPAEYNPKMGFSDFVTAGLYDWALEDDENHVPDDDELDGLGDNPYDWEAELNAINIARQLQQNAQDERQQEVGEEEHDEVMTDIDEDMADIDEETDIDEYEQYDEDEEDEEEEDEEEDGGGHGGLQGQGGQQQQQQSGPLPQFQYFGAQAQHRQQAAPQYQDQHQRRRTPGEQLHLELVPYQPGNQFLSPQSPGLPQQPVSPMFPLAQHLNQHRIPPSPGLPQQPVSLFYSDQYLEPLSPGVFSQPGSPLYPNPYIPLHAQRPLQQQEQPASPLFPNPYFQSQAQRGQRQQEQPVSPFFPNPYRPAHAQGGQQQQERPVSPFFPNPYRPAHTQGGQQQRASSSVFTNPYLTPQSPVFPQHSASAQYQALYSREPQVQREGEGQEQRQLGTVHTQSVLFSSSVLPGSLPYRPARTPESD